jgi:hypothetical protein
MKVLIPNDKAGNYDIGSIVFKKNHRLGTITFMKVMMVEYKGFKQSKTHIKFTGKKIGTKPLKRRNN